MKKTMGMLGVGLCVFFSQVSSATTWYVDASISSSGDGTSAATAFNKIQEGIDASSHGDTVLVAEGTYVENIQFKGKDIVLTGTDPLDPDVVANTIIDGSQAGSVVTFAGAEDETCVLSGFTIRNGNAEYGGGIYGNGTLATIRNNTITASSAQYGGGGLAFCDGTIQNNTITGNSATSGGGGGVSRCNGIIQNNAIAGNSGGDQGGGLAFCDGTIENNRITGNSAQYSGGLAWCGRTIQNNTITANSAQVSNGGLGLCGGTIRNCIIWANTASSRPQLYGCNIPSFSCIEGWRGGGQGNIGSEPGFVNPEAHDYHLQEGSPCIDAGASGYWFIWPQQDLDGNCRLVGLAVDMGCYEYGSSADADGDLLSDSDESAAGTDPFDEDTDADGLRDGLELLRGSNALQVTAPAVLNVPSDFATIQKSLCISVAGDEIIVSPGTYSENLHFCGPDIVLRSSDPADPGAVGSTVIDGGGAGPVVGFMGSETEACVLTGFTICNGRADLGGGIRGNGTQAAIHNNTIAANSASHGGGLDSCEGTIQNNVITDNSAVWGGGLSGCNGTIQNNTITGNSGTETGGGLFMCDGTIQNNTIEGNTGEGLRRCNGTIQNNTIQGNMWGGLS